MFKTAIKTNNRHEIRYFINGLYFRRLMVLIMEQSLLNINNTFPHGHWRKRDNISK